MDIKDVQDNNEDLCASVPCDAIVPSLNILQNCFFVFFFFPRDIESVLRRANKTEYGLASGVFTKDISKALTVADSLHAGTVFVNTYNKTDVAAPFGGFKQSGFGKDLGEC